MTISREKNSMTQGEAEAYARGFNDARDRAALLLEGVAAVGDEAHRKVRVRAASVIRRMEPTPRPEPTGLEYRGG